jgi:hypothetical protein
MGGWGMEEKEGKRGGGALGKEVCARECVRVGVRS